MGRRDGFVLVQFALLVFALLAVAALTVDLGLARAARLAMQNAADGAALEGLSGRDLWLGDPLVSDPDGSELLRRFAASRRAAEVFSEDLDPETANQRIRLGAGGVLEAFDLPDIDLAGAGGIDLTTLGVYVPGGGGFALELNESNQVFGDLVAGVFVPSTSVVKEAADYERADFAPAEASQAAAAPAFLARLRRTRDVDGLDRIPGVSSSGPTSPLIFGRGAAIGPDPDGGYDPRRDGISVRATAVARARAALRLGDDPAGWGAFLALAATGPGGEPITLGLSFEAAAFEALSAAGPVAIELFADAADGTLRVAGSPVGRLVVLSAAAPRVAVVGEVPSAPSLPLIFGAPSAPQSPMVYGRIEELAIAGQSSVIAFAGLEWISAALVEGGAVFNLVPRAGAIVPSGAAAHPGALGLAQLSPEGAILALASARLGTTLLSALCAPTLAR